MTYNDTLGDVLTLAHEIGHAFHSYIMHDVRTYAHFYPMTLAESASTFGEMILTEGILADPSFSPAKRPAPSTKRLATVRSSCSTSPCATSSRKSSTRSAPAAKLTVSRLKELMVETQRAVFGDVLAQEGGRSLLLGLETPFLYHRRDLLQLPLHLRLLTQPRPVFHV